MREILFRGKRLDNGKWIASGNIIRFNPECGEDPVFIPGLNEKCTCAHDEFDNIIAFEKVAFYKVDPKTVGQFTGLTDKNGKKIFEGDIVAQNWYDHDEPADNSFGEVVFCEYDCSFSVMDIEKDGIVPLGRCHAYHWEAEVIGNIHDNPELLGGES